MDADGVCVEFHTGSTGADIPWEFTVATQSPLQSPLQNTIVATEFSKKKGQVSFANQKLVATTVFSSGDCSGDCVATVWRLCGDCARPRFRKHLPCVLAMGVAQKT